MPAVFSDANASLVIISPQNSHIRIEEAFGLVLKSSANSLRKTPDEQIIYWDATFTFQQNTDSSWPATPDEIGKIVIDEIKMRQIPLQFSYFYAEILARSLMLRTA